MKKVLHVITDTNIGGAGRYLINLITYADARRYDMSVACPGGGELQSQIEDLGFKVFELSGDEKSFNLDHLLQIRKILSSGGFDIVHTHASFSGRIAGKFSGCNVVFTRHGIGKIKRAAIDRGVAMLSSMLFTDAIISVSRAVKVSMIEMGIPAAMIKTVHNGIDLTGYDQVRPIPKGSFGISSEGPVIGTVARLVSEKGCEFGIKAMPHILKVYPDAHLVIAGEGPLREPLEKLSRELEVCHRITFPGYQRNIEGLIAGFDVFMMPSLTEGLSLALLEVMALGKPTVATEVGGNPEVIRSGYNGVLVPSQDEHALAREVCKLLEYPEKAKAMGMRAKDTVIKNFSAELMAKKTMEIYDEILRKAGRLE